MQPRFRNWHLPSLQWHYKLVTTLLESNLAISVENQKKFVPFNPEILLLGIHLKEIIHNKDKAISPSITYNSTKLQGGKKKTLDVQ